MGKALSQMDKAFPAWGRLRYENAAFPILSFRAKARNLFRSRSGKGCEDSGEREAPCFQRIGRTVFHADSITKENGNGKRKRSLGCARDDETRERLFPFLFNLLRKPTPPRCARQPLPREGASMDTPSFQRKGGGCRFSHIVISSESEKSFPFAVKPRMREQRITGNTMLHMNWTLRCFMQTDSHRKEETRSRKRSLGSARDDDTGKRTLSHSLSYRCRANLRPFGAPPSKGRR